MAINTTLNRNESKIYLCKRLTPTTWDVPRAVWLSVMPTNADGDLLMYGTKYPSYLKVKCSADMAGLFNVGDRIYYKKDIPSTHNPIQNSEYDANYEVSAQPSITLNVADVRFKIVGGK